MRHRRLRQVDARLLENPLQLRGALEFLGLRLQHVLPFQVHGPRNGAAALGHLGVAAVLALGAGVDDLPGVVLEAVFDLVLSRQALLGRL